MLSLTWTLLNKWRISTWRQPLQPWPSVESRTHRWAPETDLQWGPRHLDIHRGKTPGTSYNLTLLQLEQTTDSSGRRGTGPPTEPGFSQGFFSILSPMEFSFLAAVASGLLSWGHFISSTIIDLIAQILLNWTKLEMHEMHSADNWVLNPVILHYWHNLPILILWSALLQFVLLKALYK